MIIFNSITSNFTLFINSYVKRTVNKCFLLIHFYNKSSYRSDLNAAEREVLIIKQNNKFQVDVRFSYFLIKI